VTDPAEIAFVSSPLPTAVVSPNGTLLAFNVALERLLQPTTGAALESYLHGADRRAFTEMLQNLSEFSFGSLEARLFAGGWVRVSAAPHHDGSNALSAVVLTLEDISAARRSQSELEYLYFFDTLTGLPNRAMLVQQTGVMLESLRRRGESLSLIFIDLDRFKLVNDTLGFETGDEMLRLVALRLKTVLRNTDLLVRMAGDEFALLLLGGEEYAKTVGRRVLELFQEPFRLEEREILSSACLGISVHPLDAADSAELQSHADLAMFSAKQQGRGRLRFFGNREDHHELEQLELEANLRHALERQELRVHYQPQYELLNGSLIGFEALLRWQHPTLGLLPPGRFVPLAEQCGLILPLSRWILLEAAKQIATWNAGRGSPLRVAVNLCAAQLERDDLGSDVRGILGQSGLEAKYLELEITETQVMTHSARLETQMRELCALGVRFGVDDFGTGYSNLLRLRDVPLNTLKVDRSFIVRLTPDPDDSDTAPLIRSIVQLAHNLKLEVLAEGVETQTQLERLHFMGCDFAQGFVFAPPLMLEDAEKLL
jgi:diguanylate cyclase (GGDEF)-like protein